MAKTSVAASERMMLGDTELQISRLEEGKDNIDVVVNVIILGASTVGKTSIFRRYGDWDII